MNVTSVVNHYPTANKGFITTLGSTISAGAVTVPLTSVSGLTNGTIFVGLIEPGLANEQEFTGVVDTAGVQITGVKWTDGTNVDHTAGVTIVDYVSATGQNMQTKGNLVSHDQDGTLKAGAVDNAAVVADGILTAAKSTTATNIETRGSETIFDHVASGCVITGDAYGSTLKWSMTAGVVYIGGVRVVVSALSAQDVVASKDTYIDVSNAGTVTFTGGNSVANNAASPALAASSIRLGIIVSGANIASVASVNQGQETKLLPIASSVPYQVTDSLGNLICPRDPQRKTLGLRQLTADASNTATSATAINLSTPVIVPTGRKISVTVNGYHFFGNTGSTNNYVGVYEGASLNALTTKKNEVKEFHASGSAGTLLAVGATYTPTSSTIWLSVALHGDAGTKTITATGTTPIVLKVELA